MYFVCSVQKTTAFTTAVFICSLPHLGPIGQSELKAQILIIFVMSHTTNHIDANYINTSAERPQTMNSFYMADGVSQSQKLIII